MTSFIYGLAIGAVSSPFLLYLGKLGLKKLKEKLGSTD